MRSEVRRRAAARRVPAVSPPAPAPQPPPSSADMITRLMREQSPLAVKQLCARRRRRSAMAGDSSVDESQLKGLAKYFNSQTNKGRANTAKATYAFMGAMILYFTLKPKSKK
ncbi:unnamed protein product [Spodoptera exigua]|nr:unnamed protein product [Spodoptera exigua]